MARHEIMVENGQWLESDGKSFTLKIQVQSFENVIESKKGRFCETLLGKWVDYSGHRNCLVLFIREDRGVQPKTN